MKRLVAIGAASLAAVASADTANLNVTANIKGTCQIQSVRSVDFGDLTQGTTAADKTAPGSLVYWCTKGVSYSVSLGNGNNYSANLRRMKGQASTNQTEYLPYQLTSSSPTSGIGKGPQAPETHNVSGTVKGADYNTLSVGGFLDTVVVTVNP